MPGGRGEVKQAGCPASSVTALHLLPEKPCVVPLRAGTALLPEEEQRLIRWELLETALQTVTW